MQQKERKIFSDPNGSLNADDAEFALHPNSWVNMENCRIGSTDAGKTSVVESIGSTILKSAVQPSNTYLTIGKAVDAENNWIVYFKKCTTGPYDRITCYSKTTDTEYIVLLNSQVTGGLNFDRNVLIEAKIQNGLLYWVEGTLNQPRRINIAAGINLNQPGTISGVTAYTSPLAQSDIAWIRRQPALPVTLTKQTDGAFSGNFIATESMQFCYRYISREYETSTLSPLSKLCNYNLDAETFNRVHLTFSLSELFTQDVLQVDLVVRFLSSAENQYFVVKSWNKNIASDLTALTNHNSGTALTYDFYNDVTGIALDKDYKVKPFDSLPLYAQTIELARNRALVGNYTIGYDTPTITSLSFTTHSVSEGTGLAGTKVFKTGSPYEGSITFYDFAGRKCGLLKCPNKINIPDRIYSQPNWNDYLTWTLSNTSALSEIPTFATSYSVNISKCLRTRFFEQLRGLTCCYVKKDANNLYTFNTYAYDGTLAGCAFDITTLTSVSMGYQYSEGDLVKIYIGSTVYTLRITGQQGGWLLTELKDLGTLDGTIQFLFEIYSPYKPLDSEPHYECGQIYLINNPGTSSRAYSTLTGTIDGDATLLQRKGINHNRYRLTAGMTSAGYHTIGCSFQNQDAADSNYTTGSSPLSNLASFNAGSDMSRFLTNTSSPVNFRCTGKIKVMLFAPFGTGTTTNFEVQLGDNNNNYIDLVPATPFKSGETKEFTFDVSYTDAAFTRRFIYGKTDEGWFVVYSLGELVISALSSAITYNTENMSPNDKFYKFWNTNAGRINLIDRIGQVNRKNSICNSNQSLDGTRTNGLCTFDALDVKDLPLECGSITKLKNTNKVQNQQGTIMLAICVKETVSMFLGERQITQPDGQTLMVSSNDVIGAINVMKGSYGTTHRESVCGYRDRIYFWDDRQGRIIQYSPNGLYAISEYKMSRFWKQFTDTFNSLSTSAIEALGGRPFVFMDVDPHHDELLISIPKLLNTPPKGYLPDYPSTIYPFDIWDGQGKTMVYKLEFGEGLPKWKGAYLFNPEYFATLGGQLYSFWKGNLYQHNDQATFNNFYGVQYKSRIMFVCNQDPGNTKVFNNIALQANMVPTFLYLYNEDPYVQTSELMDFDFRRFEGEWRSPIYRNKQQGGLMTGERMRGNYMKLMLEFTVTTIPAQLRIIDITNSISTGNKPEN
jgi:hypothetical protein